MYRKGHGVKVRSAKPALSKLLHLDTVTMTLVDAHQVCLAGGVPLPLLWPSLLPGLSCWMNSLEPRGNKHRKINCVPCWMLHFNDYHPVQISGSAAYPTRSIFEQTLMEKPCLENQWLGIGASVCVTSRPQIQQLLHGGAHRFSSTIFLMFQDGFRDRSELLRNNLYSATLSQPMWQPKRHMPFLIQPFVQNEWVELDRYRMVQVTSSSYWLINVRNWADWWYSKRVNLSFVLDFNVRVVNHSPRTGNTGTGSDTFRLFRYKHPLLKYVKMQLHSDSSRQNCGWDRKALQRTESCFVLWPLFRGIAGYRLRTAKPSKLEPWAMC